MSIYFEKLPPFLTITVMQLREATLPLSRCAFTSFHNCLLSSTVPLKSSLINMFVPPSFTLSLYLTRLHIIVRGLLPLSALSISIGRSKTSFSWNICCNFSSQSSNVSLEFLEYHLLSRYFSLIYPLDLLASARHSMDQSDSHISL